jgi:hypothetical protein
MTNSIQKKTIPLWFKALVLLSGGGAIVSYLMFMFTDPAAVAVQEHLDALKSNRISQAYFEMTAKQFQKNTTLPQFREFLTIYPVLSNNRAFRVESSKLRDDQAEISGVLISQDMQEMKADWTLVKEDKQWKLKTLHLEEINTSDSDSLMTQEMVDFVDGQLKSLRKNDVVNAYYSYVSKDFQKETPIAEFEQFIKENPILVNYREYEPREGMVENHLGYLALELISESGNYLLEYTLSRESGKWRVYALRVMLPPEVAAQKAATNPEAMIPPVKEMLEALAQKQGHRAYQITAKEFQDSTSYENFERFVVSHPAFYDHELVDIKQGMIENSTGKVKVNLHDERGITAIEFRMGYDEGLWNVWGMEVVESPGSGEGSLNTVVDKDIPPLADQLIGLLRQQIAHLHHQDIDEVYHLMMSKEYRSQHTMEQFEEFFITHPLFLDHKSSYFNRILEGNDQATLRGFLMTYEGDAYPVRFDFFKEEGKWKIAGMALLEKHEPIAQLEEVLDKPDLDLPPKPLKFVNFQLGTSVNEEGLIEYPVESLDAEVDQLFFNVYIENGLPSTLITLTLEHVESGSSAPSLSTTLDKGGRTIVSFAYAAPSQGWPPGEYIAKVESGSGQEFLFHFEVREKGRRQYRR